MADNNIPLAVSFSNSKARVYADLMAQAYWSAKALESQWFAAGYSAVVPNDSTVIDDGASTDGRPIATGADLVNMVTIAQQLIADMEASGSAKLNVVLSIAVNTQSRI